MLIRKATMRDLPGLLSLINNYAGQGIMLPRTELELAENIRDFALAEENGQLLGGGALHFYTPFAAELRSLAVDPAAKGRGTGRLIVQSLESEAEDCGLTSMFAFTYVPDFFSKMGYNQVDRGLLPQKAWKDCLRCPKFQNCDEIAVHKFLHPSFPASAPASPLFQVLPETNYPH